MSVPNSNSESAPSSEAPSTASLPEAKPRGVAMPYRIVAGLAVLLVVILALVGTAPFWAPGIVPILPWGGPPPGVASDQTAINGLQARLDADEGALTRAAAQVKKLEGDATAIKNLTSRVAALEDQAKAINGLSQRVAQLEARPQAVPSAATPQPGPPSPAIAENSAAVSALKGQMAKLAAASANTGTRLAKLEAQVNALAKQTQAGQALLLSLANLRAAVEGAGPFAAELATVETLAKDQPDIVKALTPLRDAARTGLPSLAQLSERFDREVAPAILRAGDETKSADWGKQIMARLKRLVVIRRIVPGTTLPSDPVEAAVTRAEIALKAGDLAKAVTALETLSGPSAKASSSWLTKAKSRIAAEAVLDKVWQREAARAAGGAKP